MKYLLSLFLFIQIVSSFDLTPSITRRHLLSSLGTSICLISDKVLANDDNPPLTPAEMEEYKKLLKEAERIQKIIDINIKAQDEALKNIKFNETKK